MKKSLFRLITTLAIVLACVSASQAALTVTNLTSVPNRIGAAVTGQVTATNGYNNCVFATVYYGTVDGTNVAASWTGSVAADQQCVTNGAALTATINSLSEGTTYYWRLKVTEANESNTATAWASSSKTFTTLTTARGAAGFLILPGTTNAVPIVVTNLSQSLTLSLRNLGSLNVLCGDGSTQTVYVATTPLTVVTNAVLPDTTSRKFLTTP